MARAIVRVCRTRTYAVYGCNRIGWEPDLLTLVDAEGTRGERSAAAGYKTLHIRTKFACA